MPGAVSYSVASRSMHARETYQGCLCSLRRETVLVQRFAVNRSWPGWRRWPGEYRLARPEVSLLYETVSVCFLLVTVCVLIVSR